MMPHERIRLAKIKNEHVRATVDAINFDLLSVVLRNIHCTVVVVSSEVSHITMQCHSVIESTLIRFTTQIVSLTKEKKRVRKLRFICKCDSTHSFDVCSSVGRKEVPRFSNKVGQECRISIVTRCPSELPREQSGADVLRLTIRQHPSHGKVSMNALEVVQIRLHNGAVGSCQVIGHVKAPVAEESTSLIDERPGQVDASRHVTRILDNLNTSARGEHDDNLRLVEDVRWRVDGDAMEELELQALSIEVDSATVGEHV